MHDALETMWCLLLVVLVVVDAHDERDVRIGRGRRDQHLLRAGFEVLRGSFARGEQAGRLDDDVDAELVPRQRLRVALAEHAERRAVDADRVALDLDAGKPAVRRVVVEQVREDVRRREVVHGDDVELAAALQVRANEVAPDPAEAVDSNLECHRASLVTEVASVDVDSTVRRIAARPRCPSRTTERNLQRHAGQSAKHFVRKRAGRGESSEDDPSPRFAALRTAMTDGV